MENAPAKESFLKRPWVQSLIGIVLVLAALGGFLYWKSTSAYVAIDMSQVSAPVIAIGPESEGILSEVYVQPGDMVAANESLARVGSETLSAKTAGIVVSVMNTPGQVFQPGTPVVSMIDSNQLRIVGKIDEDKGLSRIKVGDPAESTVDAFGSTKFTGVVDEVSPTSDQSSVVFSISDTRPTMQFDVKVRYDIQKYPALKNGMSAKLRIYAR